MSAFGTVYVVDNNGLTFLKVERRAAAFFRENCRIPSEVLHEAQGFPDIENLRRLEYSTTASVLTILVEVMESLPVSDTKLVDLYANKGNADPLVVACALDGAREEQGTLLPRCWTVVSGDKAVQEKAREFGLEVKTNEQFIEILENSSSPEK